MPYYPYSNTSLAQAYPPWMADGGQQSAMPPEAMAIPADAGPPQQGPPPGANALAEGGPPMAQGPGYGMGMDQQSNQRAALQSALAAMAQGSTVGGMGEPIPPEYMKQAATLRSLYQPGPMEQRFAEANAYTPPDVYGLKARLAGIGKGLLMGGLGGAVLGGADPSMANRAYYRAHLPAMAQAAQAEEQQRQSQLKRAQELEGLTGIDPMTGLRGPTALNRDYMNALAFGRLGQGQERIDVAKDRAQTYRDVANQRLEHYKTMGEAAQKAQARADYNSGMLNTPEGLAWAAEQLGVPASLMPKFQAGAVKVGGDFNFIDVRTGQPVTDAEGKPIASSEKPKFEAGERRRRESEAQGRERIGQGAQRIAQGEQRLTDAEEKQIDKDARAKHKLPPFHDPKLDEPNAAAIEQEKASMRAAKLAQRAKGGGGGAATYPPLTRQNMKQGGTYTYQGKRVRVAELSPDGKFRLEALP